MMFIRVVLPAPFSPSMQWIWPFFSVKSMWSLATTPGKRLVMPRASRTGGCSIRCSKGSPGDDAGGVQKGAPLVAERRPFLQTRHGGRLLQQLARDRVDSGVDGAVRQALANLLEPVRKILRHIRAVRRRIGDAAVGRVPDVQAAAGIGAGQEAVDLVIHAQVHPLDRAGDQELRTRGRTGPEGGEVLVLIHADDVDPFLAPALDSAPARG